jgi:hypothetical protein
MIRSIEPLVEVYNEFGYQNISEFISSLRIQTSVKSPVGIAVLTINPSATSGLPTSLIHNAILNEAQRKLKLNSIVSIKIDNSSKRHSFLGRIDNIYPRISADGNSTRRELIVNCSMLLPKLLMRDEIINFPLIKDMPGAKQKLGAERVEFINGMRGNIPAEGINVFQGGKPEVAVKYIIDNCVATNTDVLIGASGSKVLAKSFFNPKKAEIFKFNFLSGEQLYNPMLSVFAGPLLNYIYQCIDTEFYELFFDTETGEDGFAYNTMTIRSKPFSFSEYKPQHGTGSYKVVRGWIDFDQLDSVTKTSEQRLNDTTGISDYELKNSFSVNFQQSILAPANSLFGQLGPLFPLINFDNIKKYGLRHYQAQSTIVNFEKSREEYNKNVKDSSPQDLAKVAGRDGGELDYLFDKREKLFEWYAYPFFESGAITWVGDENLKIGQNLVYEDKEYLQPDDEKVYRGVEYYVDTVIHEFAYGRFFKTTTELSRGAPAGVAAKWLNKNRGDFSAPSLQEYNAYINPSPTVNAEELTAIDDVRTQWREITEI